MTISMKKESMSENMSPSQTNKSRKTQKEIKQYMRYKLVGLFFMIALALCVLFGKMIYRVATAHESDTQKVLEQMNYSSSIIQAQRGSILDCNMTPIAESKPMYILILDPKVMTYDAKADDGVNNLDPTLEALEVCFGLNQEEVRAAVMADTTVSYLRYGGKLVYTYEEMTVFEEYKAEFNSRPAQKDEEGNTITQEKITGVWFETEYQRLYPYNDVGSKVIGFTSTDGSAGINGIELQYNDLLAGVNGRKYGYLNQDSDLERVTIDAEDGCTIVSTIDMNISSIISRNLKEWKETYGARAIHVLAMDPDTGAVKAMISDSDFDLNNPKDLSGHTFPQLQETNAETGELQYRDMTEDEMQNYLWNNFMVSGTFEPGSTAKCFTLAAALEENAVTQENTYNCTGDVTLSNGVRIKCHNYPIGGCGLIDLTGAFTNSCNVAYVDIGQALGSTQFARYQEIFNFGQKTGIDLPGEASAAGLLHTVESLQVTELATCAFGQGFNVSMIQMASAFSSLINGGNYYRPYVVKEIIDDEGNVTQKTKPVLLRQTVSKETSEYFKDILYQVVEEGTAQSARLEGYMLGGKTGTAEKLPRSAEKYIVSLISAAPIENPDLVLYVAIDEPQTELQADSYPAQELTRWIWEDLYPYLGIYPEN